MAEEGERMIAESIEQARSQLPQAPTGDDGFPDDDEFTDSSDDNFPCRANEHRSNVHDQRSKRRSPRKLR